MFRLVNWAGENPDAVLTTLNQELEISEGALRDTLLSLGGEDIEEVVRAKELLYVTVVVFQNWNNNICGKSWVRMRKYLSFPLLYRSKLL